VLKYMANIEYLTVLAFFDTGVIIMPHL